MSSIICIIAVILQVNYILALYIINKKLKNPYKVSLDLLALDVIELPVVSIKINDHVCNMIVDSGANMSLLSPKAAKKFNVTHVDNYQCKTTVYGLDGIEHNTSIYSVSYKIKGITYIDDVQLLDITDVFKDIQQASGIEIHGLLGSKFLTKYGYILDYTKLILGVK